MPFHPSLRNVLLRYPALLIVQFMDNKINLAGGMIMRLRATYNLSLEAQVYYHYGYTSSEHDAVLLAWKEKVAHNLVRPTTTVQASQVELCM